MAITPKMETSRSAVEQDELEVVKSTTVRTSRKLILMAAAAVALFVHSATGWADTTTDINQALTALGFSTTILNATPDQLRQAVSKAAVTNSSTEPQVATYVTDVLNIRYPTNPHTPTLSASVNTANLTARGTNAPVILKGGVQGLVALGNTTVSDYSALTVAASNVTYVTATLDATRASLLAATVGILPTNAATITGQYLTGQPIVTEANAPAFATTVVKALPLAVNATNQTDFAGTTAAVTAKYVAAAIGDTNFGAKAGVARAVVVAVPTFAEETIREVSAQLQGELSGIVDQGSVATAFATAIASNSGTSKMADTTKALVAQGVALAFAGQEGKVAKAVADLPTAAASPAPTAASRAAIAAAVAKAVPAATQDIAARVASSLGTNPTAKISFGAALIPLLPATSGVTNAAKSIAAGLADPNYSTFADDNARIAFAQSFAGFNATTKAVGVSSLIAGGVATQLTDMTANAPTLAAGVAFTVNAAASSPAIAAEVARVAPAGVADEIAFAVASMPTPALADVNRTAIASAVLSAVATGSRAGAAPDIADKIAGIEADANKAALATALGKIVYTSPTAVGSLAKKISDHVTSSTTVNATTQVSPADTIRQAIASAALRSGIPTTFNASNAPAIVAAATAIAQSGILTQFNSAVSMANLANTLVLAAPTYATTTVGVSTVAGDIAIAVAQQLSNPADKAAAANAATKASLAQAVTIAVAVANYGAGTDTLSTHPLNDAGKALVAQKVALVSTGQAVNIANAIVALVDGDGVPANVDQSKANVAKGVVTSVPTQAVAVATAVATPLGGSGRVLVAQAVAQGLSAATVTSAGPVAAAVAALSGNSVTTKASIASSVAAVLPTQAVDVADKVASPTVAADKAIIAAAVAAIIPAANQTSATIGTAALAAKIAGQITVGSGNPNAATQIAAIAQAVAGAGGFVSLTIAPDIAGAVAAKFFGTLPAAAPTIASQVAGLSGMTIANQAAVAKSVATAVVAQASAVATTTLTTSLTQNAGTTAGTTPDAIAGVFAVAIPAQAAPIAGSATTYYANTYLGLHPATTIRAGDIAVSVATSAGVTTSVIPAIASQVAQAIFPSNRAAIGGIADKFAAGMTGATPGNLSQTNFNAQAPGIASSLGTVAAPAGRESSELAGIVAALTEALPVTTAANMALVASITKNVAQVATNYWATQSVTYKPDDLIGFLVAELITRGVSQSLAAGSVLATLRSNLTTPGSAITLATVDAVFNAGTTGNVNINPVYASGIGGAGLGTIGDVLSNTTPVTNF